MVRLFLLFTLGLLFVVAPAQACETPDYVAEPFDVQVLKRRMAAHEELRSDELIFVRDYEEDVIEYMKLYETLYPCAGEAVSMPQSALPDDERFDMLDRMEYLESKWGWDEDDGYQMDEQTVIFE